MSSGTLNRLTSAEQLNKIDRDERRARFNQIVIVLTLILLVAAWVFGILQGLRQPKINELVISNVQTIGPTALCPGDGLLFEFDYSVQGEGKLDFDTTAWFVDPPKRIVFTKTEPFLMSGNVQERVRYLWIVPFQYVDLATQQPSPLPAGAYNLNFGLTSPSRSAVSEVEIVSFSIRADCPPYP